MTAKASLAGYNEGKGENNLRRILITLLLCGVLAGSAFSRSQQFPTPQCYACHNRCTEAQWNFYDDCVASGEEPFYCELLSEQYYCNCYKYNCKGCVPVYEGGCPGQ